MPNKTPAQKVKRISTPVSSTEMSGALIKAWKNLFDTTPTKEQLAVVMAQNNLETGHRKSMYNFNVGNITTDGFSGIPYFDDLETNEQIKPGIWEKANLKYRAYPNLDAGVLDYLKFIKRRPAFKYVLSGDPGSFSKSLKMSGYYTGNEEPYTKSLIGLHNQYLKSKDYERALSGAKDSVPTAEIIQFKKKDKNMGNKSLSGILDSYLKMIAASEKQNKKLYRKYLSNNDIVIKINASEYANAVEFSRILCSALDEELLARSYTHTDGTIVEIDCSIPGPSYECFEAVKELTSAVENAFKQATAKIGTINIDTQFVMNKKSSYQQIGFESASAQYRKFLLKFV